MIYSLMVRGPVVVRPNSKGKLNVPTGRVSIEGKPEVIKTSVEELVSIGYWFNPEQYGALPQYVDNMRKVFQCSLPVVHLVWCEQALAVLRAFHQWFTTVPVILHVPVTDMDMADGARAKVYEVADSHIGDEAVVDRLMIDDCTTSLYTVDAEKMRKLFASAVGLKISDIGICGSPLSDRELCCLSARLDREWSVPYGGSYMVLPSANHQSMDTCGCLRFVNVIQDVITYDGGQKPGASKSKGPKTPKAPKIKAPKRSPKAVMHP